MNTHKTFGRVVELLFHLSVLLSISIYHILSSLLNIYQSNQYINSTHVNIYAYKYIFKLIKVNDRSSWYSPVSTVCLFFLLENQIEIIICLYTLEVRLEGSFLYEEFIPADGTIVFCFNINVLT